MRFTTRRLRRAVLAAVTLALALLTAHLALGGREPPLPVLDTVGGPFTLPSTRGGALSLDDLRGQVVLLNFGYTDCPEVCPTVLARLRAVLLDLDALGIPVQPLFVTLDPERDELPVLSRYLAHFHPSLVGLRGSPEQTAEVARRYQVYYQRTPAGEDGGYALDHSVHIYLIDPAGRVRATFGADVPVERMVATVRRLRSGRGGFPW
ncbi:MAG TPA: SCO family protein [Pseudomonadales bacterium]